VRRLSKTLFLVYVVAARCPKKLLRSRSCRTNAILSIQIARSRVALPETPGDGGVLVSRDLQKLKALMQASGR